MLLTYTFDELKRLHEDLIYLVESGYVIAFYFRFSVGFVLRENWDGVGVVLSKEELQKFFDEEQKAFNFRWN